MSDAEDLLSEVVASKRTRRAERLNIDVQRDFRDVFLRTDAGQRILRDLFHMCRAGDETTAATSDPYQTYFREGQRSISQKIRRILYEDVPAQRPTMQQTVAED